MAPKSDPVAETIDTASFGLPLLQGNWKWFLVRGVLAIALGIVAVLFPLGAVLAFMMLFAAFSFVDGVVSIASGVSNARESNQRWWALILRGSIGVLVAAVFLVMPFMATLTYAIVSLVVVAVWAIFTGAFEIAAAVRLRRLISGEWLLGLSGALSLLLGLVILAVVMIDPVASILSVAWIIGIYAVISGIALVGLGLRLRTHAPYE